MPRALDCPEVCLPLVVSKKHGPAEPGFRTESLWIRSAAKGGPHAHRQKLFYGIAFADLALACPATLAGVVLALLGVRWGLLLLAWVSCWFVWANLMTTAPSLRFERPRITLTWLLVFPFGAVVGLAFVAWTLVHLEFLSVS